MINVKFEGELRNVTTRGYKKRDGSDALAYDLLLETKDTSYTVNTCMEVYNDFVSGKIAKGMSCEFSANYEPRFQFNNFNIVCVVPAK